MGTGQGQDAKRHIEVYAGFWKNHLSAGRGKGTCSVSKGAGRPRDAGIEGES